MRRHVGRGEIMLKNLFKPKAVKVKPVFKEKIPYSETALAYLRTPLLSGIIALQYDEESIKIFSCIEQK